MLKPCEPIRLGEFLCVSDKEVGEWCAAGKITGTSVVDLLMFAATNSRDVSNTQERFEKL